MTISVSSKTCYEVSNSQPYAFSYFVYYGAGLLDFAEEDSMSRASTLVKTAAMAMMMVWPSFPAAAQQMATAAPSPNFAACDAIKDPALSVQCYHDTKIAHYKGRIEAAEVRLAQTDIVAGCVDFLKRQKADGKSFDRPITRANACAVAHDMGMRPN
jgi:hypothetical protein